MSNFANVLINGGGKWVGMVLQMREAMRSVDAFRTGRIIVASMEAVTPAGCFADEACEVPPIKDSKYIDCLLEICARKKVRVVVPLMDVDLVRLAPHSKSFALIGTKVICPEAELVELCFDKSRFENFLKVEGIQCPRTFMLDELKGAKYPLFYKPRKGFGSMGSGVCHSFRETQSVLTNKEEVIWQEFIDSSEVSVDVYISHTRKCTVCVQRIRDKVVAGEAYRSHTVAIAGVQTLALRAIEALARRGLMGPVNLQVFASDPPLLIEVNTRLGSASVFSNVASGGRLLNSMLTEACGGTSQGDPNDYTVGMELYRFLGDVCHLGADIVKISPAKAL